ncbi:copper transporter family protein [Aulographum hederae CBS 113979]|uniref:Copper transport protein n=1 Tax=Aulographum hederae CBS 113979 TaxID=1176131 RepID=A0A6G1HF30_9PEZI|nr:copper transporter family protein [Aulographum hederae CBS 113979]
MDGMSMSTTMDASEMAMTFFTAYNTPLFSKQFTPNSTGQYAGACIFLIILTVIFRSLYAFKSSLESRWRAQAVARRYIVIADKLPESERIQQDPDAKSAVLSVNGVEEGVRIIERPMQGQQPWRFSVDLPRAALVTVMAGVGYLLMLAVMTFNVGYFCSVLAGTFVGEVAVGRFIVMMEEHH